MSDKDEKKKIRILHVAQAAGGVDRYIQMLMKYLDSDKFENVFICSYDFKPDDYKNLVIAIEQVDMHRRISFADFKVIFCIRKLIRRYKPDIVYAHSSKAGAVTRIADIGIKNTCIYNSHGWAFNMRCSLKKQKLYTLIEKIAAPFCKKIICISNAEKESALTKRICTEKKLQVILNGIDIEGYESIPHDEYTRHVLNIPDDAYIVGMVGRISPQKAPDVFIKAAKRIKRDIPTAYFIIVGSGEQEGDVKGYAEKNGLADSLLITGWVDNPMSYVELFDIALLLSRWEGFGLVLPEYMLAKKPIVASCVDAIPNIIEDRENGLLVDVDDVEGTYKAVMELYENEKLRTQIIEKGYVDVHSRFNMKRVAEEHENLLFEYAIKKKY